MARTVQFPLKTLVGLSVVHAVILSNPRLTQFFTDTKLGTHSSPPSVQLSPDLMLLICALAFSLYSPPENFQPGSPEDFQPGLFEHSDPRPSDTSLTVSNSVSRSASLVSQPAEARVY